MLFLHDFLRKEIRKMASGVGVGETGNIFPLVIAEVEKCIIETALRENRFNYFATAKMLGIGRSTLYRKIKQFGIKRKKIT
jgi:sigma-54 dependent transcriptional regulator, acetoin dehydrogenase operon transcriptional activator AcoR